MGDPRGFKILQKNKAYVPISTRNTFLLTAKMTQPNTWRVHPRNDAKWKQRLNKAKSSTQNSSEYKAIFSSRATNKST